MTGLPFDSEYPYDRYSDAPTHEVPEDEMEKLKLKEPPTFDGTASKFDP